jgi:hypothetical protein
MGFVDVATSFWDEGCSWCVELQDDINYAETYEEGRNTSEERIGRTKGRLITQRG